MKNILLCLTLIGVLAVVTPAQKQNFPISEPLDNFSADDDPDIGPNIDKVHATILNQVDGAEKIINKLVSDTSKKELKTVTVDNKLKDVSGSFMTDKNFYCIIHILKWADPPDAADKSKDRTVQAQNWYLYHAGKLDQGDSSNFPRLYAARAVTFLYIHLNKDENYKYRPYYEVEVAKKRPAYLDHFLGLVGLFFSNGTPATSKAVNPLKPDGFAVKSFAVHYLPSNITIKPEILEGPKTVSLGNAQQFDNEGKYFLDFSVGVPLNTVKAASVTFDGTNGTFAPKEVNRETIFAFINLYPVPVDIKKTNFTVIPHFVGGVGIANAPLHRIFVGAGFGPYIANLYIGALYSKDQFINGLPPSKTNVNGPVTYEYKPHFAFGFNLPVGVIAEKLKKH